MIVSVYATFGSREEADRIAEIVVEERLAACANIDGDVRSIYRWEGKIEHADEIAAVFKTAAGRVDDLIARIAALHSYSNPAIVTWPVEATTDAYAAWVEAETRSLV